VQRLPSRLDLAQSIECAAQGVCLAEACRIWDTAARLAEAPRRKIDISCEDRRE